MNNGEKMNGGFDESNNDFNVENNLNQERERKIGEMANSKVNSENDSETRAGEIDISAYQRMFAERDAERARDERMSEKRRELAHKAREKAAFKKKVANVVKASAISLLIAGSIVAATKISQSITSNQYASAISEIENKASTGENSDQEVQTELGFETPDETIKIESATFYGAPHVREVPIVSHPEAGFADYGRLGEEDEKITVDLDTAYLKEKNDANGDWYGFEAEELAEELLEGDYISEWTANSMAGDGNGLVWVNSKYCHLERATDTNETEDTTGTKEASDSEGFESLFNN